LIHGNGPSKRHLNHLGNYIPKAWNEVDQCTACWEDNLSFDEMTEVPQIAMAVIIPRPTPFMEEFFEKLELLDYPKAKIDVLVYVGDEYHTKHVESFLKNDATKEYNSVKILGPKDVESEEEARKKAVDLCVETKCDYYFNVDSIVHLDNPKALRLLVEQNRSVLSPMLLRPGKAWSNFWGALGSDGYYARSSDYMEIVQYKRHGVWNVPFLSACYLIQGSVIHNENTRPKFEESDLDAGEDLVNCQFGRNTTGWRNT
jgi:hypothetical protein